MARGWESKSVEEQIEAAEARRKPDSKPAQLTPDELRVQAERERLEASLSRVLKDLDSELHPRHREQLEAALAFLKDKLETLQRS